MDSALNHSFMHLYRLGTIEDLSALLDLEAACFEPSHRESRQVLRRCLTSSHQEVWLRTEAPAMAAVALRKFTGSLKLFSIAVHPNARGRGWGQEMLNLTDLRAHELGLSRIRLEVAANDERLVRWYEAAGFTKSKRLVDYYDVGDDAWRMEKRLN
jgi:ribosomal protein S18 acetylase RimI-like enzyme